ncbi:sigma 54-interacting transcriptional regulator [Thalassotalea castellviae]|uniref:HTH-type transcriptional regulatory protein TyrR n=1 Tax=Thalassotalea castellviae TaxID=3075612 RepID=A0ABU3A2M8_9GAMM|nr:sigma 54-interacting transcriptional regulator [Thalassotalea sp. W431]MDT0604433.1 sigma 54-interacting transcriptional regulator [Thalassotalea sp. W431]
MRVKIESSDRIGISQEILSIFSLKFWNVKSIEVETNFTFVHLDSKDLSLADIKRSLKQVSGVIDCIEIDQMPAELRENHLQTLLSRISDPIIDIDAHGVILASNAAANQLVINNSKITSLVNHNIIKLIDVPLKHFLTSNEVSLSINFLQQPFIADVNPVVSAKKITGAVISLKSMDKVGRQLALMQSSTDDALKSIIGVSEKIRLVLAQVKRFSELDLPVLISGDTGTGKELIARALHQLSDRKQKPFLTINCAALPEQLLESELFGYESGAFTGASKGGKPGLFELAHGGTIFLDEIAEMSNYLQAKLLRFLQDYKYRKVGGTKEFTADVKVISASHQNFTELIEQQQFREDLYYRLNVLRLELPALRHRTEDIQLLVNHFVLNAASQVNQRVPFITEEALKMLKAFHWPGNIRQLENVIFRLVALSENDYITEENVSSVLFESNMDLQSTPIPEEGIVDWADAQARFERKLLTELYPLYPTTRKLAERLNVSHNKIAMKLRAYQIKAN